MHPVRETMRDSSWPEGLLQDPNERQWQALHARLWRPQRPREQTHRNQTLLPLLARLDRTNILHMVLQLRLRLVSKSPSVKDRASACQVKLLLS